MFDKARMGPVLAAVAGSVIAAALVLAVICCAAYFGAFSRYSPDGTEQTQSFDPPETTEGELGVETVNEGTETKISVYVTDSSRSKDGSKFRYAIKIVNDNDIPAEITDVRMTFYDGARCVGSYTMSEPFQLYGFGIRTMSGEADIYEADTALFYVTWRDGEGLQASTYTKVFF
ncbi:MAG: hypothetical protein J5879_00340 [Clostridia bacterium]|nr:hypothetical protein [Clostridia bacterium]